MFNATYTSKNAEKVKIMFGFNITVGLNLFNFLDPSPALDSLLQVQKKSHKLQDLEIENSNLKDTINQYNKEFAEVKNQGKIRFLVQIQAFYWVSLIDASMN